tara:strand:- start:490 stop:1392 length:903 start_codon:yes stop_codon:yes gene_type:complete
MANGGDKDKKKKNKSKDKRIKGYKKEKDVKTDECKNVFGKALDSCRARKTKRASNKKTKENKFYSAEVSATDAPTYNKETSKPGMEVTHTVTGGNKDGTVDYVSDNAGANKALAKSIGGKVTSDVKLPTEGEQKTIQGSGMKSGYHSQQLYKKTKSGELKAKKGIKMEGAMPMGESFGILPSSAAITRRGKETTYESTRGMDRKEIRGARKRAHELDPENTTRYVSQDKLNRKAKRIQTQIDRKTTNKKGVKQKLDTKPVQNYTYATDDTHPYNYATPTDEARKFAGSSTRMNRKIKIKR